MTIENDSSRAQFEQLLGSLDSALDTLKLVKDDVPLEVLDALQKKEIRLIEEIEEIRRNLEKDI